MTQGSLHEESAKLRKDANETSRLAALRAAPKSGTQRHALLLKFAAAGARGMTDDEVADAMVWSPNTARPRRVELLDGGWVGNSGSHRPSFYDNPATVWVITEQGVEYVKNLQRAKEFIRG
jgi:hypothetical protein